MKIMYTKVGDTFDQDFKEDVIEKWRRFLDDCFIDTIYK